ncbi:hypothetical protein CF392_15795 [Tamilnaduibacter salinus]|uniref:Uncharacterized protein n=1 Tax=Tamilnaduibacter salinus TaxID=1484056 RepID=A0A2A2HZQ7_9GAMM|nr:hypothetical protein [Tamilnaduibacter salinus]PAV24526.1 hypothetical protein CF392_15795 [Tamilnaduibacter salinus]
MGNIATTYGLLPSDIGSAQALSMFSQQVSATYYNPAYLATDSRGEMTAGFLHAEPDLRAKAPNRQGDTLSSTRSQQVTIGFQTDLSRLVRVDHPVQLGVMLGVEKYGREMLAFNGATSESGQFLEYGRQPLFLTIGGGTPIWRGINVGYSARVTLHSEASLRTTTDLAGNTQHEKLSVSAKPAVGSTLQRKCRCRENALPRHHLLGIRS